GFGLDAVRNPRPHRWRLACFCSSTLDAAKKLSTVRPIPPGKAMSGQRRNTDFSGAPTMTWSIRRLFRHVLAGHRKPVLHRARLDLAEMERRCVPAVTAVFDANQHTLAIVGSAQSDNVVLSRDAAEHILLNGQLTGAKLANTDTITVFTGDSNDAVT